MEQVRSANAKHNCTMEKERDVVKGGVESHCPPLFWVLAGLGVHLVSRGPDHQYRLARWRLVPPVCLAATAILIIAPTIAHTVADYSRAIVWISFMILAIQIFATITIYLINRHTLCKLLSALVTQVPQTSYLKQTVVGCICIIYIVGHGACIPWQIGHDNIPLHVIAFLFTPVLPSAIDLYCFFILNSLVNAHYLALQDIMESHSSGADTFPRLVRSGKQVFSTPLVLRCAIFLANGASITYILFLGHTQAINIFHLVDEVARFGVLCWQADGLTQAWDAVKEAVWDLNVAPNTPAPQRCYLHVLTSRLACHRPHVSVGRMASLGTGLMACLVNAAFTYAIILHQSQP